MNYVKNQFWLQTSVRDATRFHADRTFRVLSGRMIAIIAILAAILFPVFARARENARRASCGSNLKQIGLGIMQYLQDYDEKYPMMATMATPTPAFYGGRDWGMWMVNIHPYVKSTQLYNCPSSRSRATTTYTNTPSGTLTFALPGHYGVNQYVIQDGQYSQEVAGTPNSGVAAASIGAAALLMMASDCAGPITGGTMWRVINASRSGNPTTDDNTWTSVGGPAAEADARHLGGSNILFADGHVKFQSQGQMGLDPTRTALAEPYKFKIPIARNDDRVN